MQATAEMIWAEIATLPVAEREKLRLLFNRQAAELAAPAPPNGYIPPFDDSDAAPSLRWLNEHRHEYAGQYVALDGDRLIAHGTDPQQIIAAVRASGLNGLFFTLVPAADAPPFAGF